MAIRCDVMRQTGRGRQMSCKVGYYWFMHTGQLANTMDMGIKAYTYASSPFMQVSEPFKNKVSTGLFIKTPRKSQIPFFRRKLSIPFPNPQQEMEALILGLAEILQAS